jgi:hypothetical protein
METGEDQRLAPSSSCMWWLIHDACMTRTSAGLDDLACQTFHHLRSRVLLMEEEEFLFLSASPTYAARQGSIEHFTRARGIILSRASFVSNGINSDRNG